MRDRFLVRAPIDDVWEFLMDSRRVVLCMPGAHLEQIESDRAYLASVKVAVGPFTTSYKGRVEFAEADESLHRARLTAEGQERGGGAAHGSMVSSLRTVEEGTEVIVDVSFEGASRIVHLGLGLTQNLAQELFGQFVTCVKERLEAPLGASSSGETPADAVPVQVLPLLAKAFLRRFGAKRSPK
jgi:uncharacterized protein